MGMIEDSIASGILLIEAEAEIDRLKLQNDQLRQGWSNTIMDGDDIPLTRPEPSRLEIAAMLLAAMCGSQYTWTNAEGIALRKADALIAGAKEGK